MPKSFKAEVYAEGQWTSNSFRFTTPKEAEAYGSDLLTRWWVPKAARSAPSDDPVTHRFDVERKESFPIVDHSKNAVSMN